MVSKVKVKQANKKTNYWYAVKMGVFFGIVGVLIMVSMTAFWLQRNIFNTERFTAMTTQAILQESSRQAIGTQVSTIILANQPALKMVIGDKLSGQISGLLGTEFAENSINRVAREAQLVITSPKKAPIVFQLSSIKGALVAVQNVASKTGKELPGGLSTSSIPDEIVIVDTQNMPNIHALVVATAWLGPLSLVLAVAALAWWVMRAKKHYRLLRVRYSLIVVAATAVVALVVGPLVEPVIMAVGQTAPEQTILRNIFRVFIKPFNMQATLLLMFSLVAYAVLLAWDKFIRHYTVKVAIRKKV